MMPIANWDQLAARETSNGSGVSDRRWPLFSLVADANNWLEFYANCENKGYRVRLRVNGGTPTNHDFGDSKQVWRSDSPLLVGIGYRYSSGATRSKSLYVGASLGGDIVRTLPSSVSVGWSNKTFSELRFRSSSGGYSSSGEVCEFRWFGGEINQDDWLDNDDLRDGFVDLGFLAGP